jgi:hypothetical protein
MAQQVRRSRWGLLGAGLLGLAVGAWGISRWLAAEPGSAEDVFSRIRVGMTQEEAVAILRTYDPGRIDGVYAEGTTRQGRSWSGTSLFGDSFADLPPPEDTARCVLTVTDDDCWEVEVVLGPGGIVSGKHISPGVWEYRLREACRVVTLAAADVVSGSWWGEQYRKTCRSLRRGRYARPCLVVVLVLVSAWALRRRRARSQVCRAVPVAAPDSPRERR